MQVTIENVSEVEKKVAVQIPWPAVAQKLDVAYRKLGRDVALKGFRKGKVPRNILERMYGPQVEAQVTRELVQESFVMAASEHSLEPVAEPVVNDVHMHKGESFHYSARVEVRGEIVPQDYEGIELHRRAPRVSDEEVTRALERKREELTEYKAIENRDPKVTTDRDILLVKLVGTVGDKAISREQVPVDLSAQGAYEPVPGLGKALHGIPLDAVDHAVSLQVPQAEGDPIEARLQVTITEAREKQMPALDDEFAKDTGEADTLDELRAKLHEKLIDEDKKRAEAELKQELLKALCKRNAFAIAPALVERQLDTMVERAKMTLALRGLDPKLDTGAETRLRDELREAANDEVRAALLVDAIGQKEKIETTDADLEKRLSEMAEAREKNSAKVKAELQKEGKLQALRYQIREEKTLDLLLSRSKII